MDADVSMSASGSVTRMQKLEEVLKKALDEFCLTAQSSGALERCFPTLSKTHGEMIQAVLAQGLNAIRDNSLVRVVHALGMWKLLFSVLRVQKEFETIADECDLADRLGKLDRVCAEGVPVPPAPWTRHLKQEILGEIVRAKRAEEARLQQLLATMEADNTALESNVAALDADAARLCTQAQALAKALESKSGLVA